MATPGQRWRGFFELQKADTEPPSEGGSSESSDALKQGTHKYEAGFKVHEQIIQSVLGAICRRCHASGCSNRPIPPAP